MRPASRFPALAASSLAALLFLAQPAVRAEPPAPTPPASAPEAPQGTAPATPAQPAPGHPGSGEQPRPSPAGGFGEMLPMIVIMGVLFYFMVWRPQRKEEKKRKEMLDALRKNDEVLTSSGMFGTVTNVSGEEVTVKVDDVKDVRIRFSRSAITKVLEPDQEAKK